MLTRAEICELAQMQQERFNSLRRRGQYPVYGSRQDLAGGEGRRIHHVRDAIGLALIQQATERDDPVVSNSPLVRKIVDDHHEGELLPGALALDAAVRLVRSAEGPTLAHLENPYARGGPDVFICAWVFTVEEGPEKGRRRYEIEFGTDKQLNHLLNRRLEQEPLSLDRTVRLNASSALRAVTERAEALGLNLGLPTDEVGDG